MTILGHGGADQLDRFERELMESLPPLARVDTISSREVDSFSGNGAGFEIIGSEQGATEGARVTVDSATCASCCHELLDPEDRRYRHPLINCTDCGPRFTIVRDTPYDRTKTTMAAFAMCDSCAREYGDPGDRRFHAQPNCCHDCGPRVELRDARGNVIEGDPIRGAAERLARGEIVAIKGLGGYNLACDAKNEEAVAALRARKRRDHKAFALMVKDVEVAGALVELSEAGAEAMGAPAAPIVLAPARESTGVAAGVAPGMHRLGVMVANTPLHHLLFAEGLGGGGALVMTSANLSDDPLVKDDGDVPARLGGMYDAVLSHDRLIERAVDDSVVMDMGGRGTMAVRRARGYVPEPMALPVRAPEAGVCVGAELKNTVALVSGDRAIVSQHIGDLSHMLAYERSVRTIDDLERLFEIEPVWVACDPHPGYVSRMLARRIAKQRGIPLYEVQHHHAHMASVLAEHGRTERAVGLICDGVGYGADGSAWGGEVLVGDLEGFERVGRVRPILLPGGDAAAKQTGRCAAAWLFDRLGVDARSHAIARRVLDGDDERGIVFSMLEGGMNAPASSGMGRLFDACAALLGVCGYNHHEAMSGQLLESAAWGDGHAGHGESGEGLMPMVEAGGLMELDHRPLLDRLLGGLERGDSAGALSWVFHEALSDGLARAAIGACERAGVRVVALSGGVFCNGVLSGMVVERLERVGLECLMHHRVPANDGGLSYGQAAVVSARLGRSD